jgi:hypothetical protein
MTLMWVFRKPLGNSDLDRKKLGIVSDDTKKKPDASLLFLAFGLLFLCHFGTHPFLLFYIGKNL